MNTPPSIVTQLAAKDGGTLIAWKEYEDHWALVFEDGRKVNFDKADILEEKPAHAPKAAPPKKEK